MENALMNTKFANCEPLKPSPEKSRKPNLSQNQETLYSSP